jgi:hypothetical protein
VGDRDEGGPKIRTIFRRRRLLVIGSGFDDPTLARHFFAGPFLGLPGGAREKQQDQDESRYRCR